MGADYIEPDRVSTKDHVLVARHENDISATTDVASHPEFANRRTTKVIDGMTITGWFTEDFTLAEVKTLRAKERLPDLRPNNTVFDGLYEIPTFQEVIDLAKRKGVGIYPETKHPTYFDRIGLSLEEPRRSVEGERARQLPVTGVHPVLRGLQPRAAQPDDEREARPLLDAVGKPYDFVVSGDPRTYADLAKPAGLTGIAGYADGIGPNKNLIVPRNASNDLLTPTTFVGDAHKVGLVLHPWTFRRENSFQPEEFRQGNAANPLYLAAPGNLPGELELFYKLGVDGLFSDNPTRP
jgi:glycerophosphoryl diester phosphodiesterase